MSSNIIYAMRLCGPATKAQKWRVLKMMFPSYLNEIKRLLDAYEQ